jgi:hypothetical protein
MRDPLRMSASNILVGKPKVRTRPTAAKVALAKQLTEAWRKRVRRIHLNKPGQKRLTLHQLITASRR